ncbi:unnamed protein product [Durusdinium trenchii]|uniref:Uncharacterized protein n=1 Tax=Durusdinium trenchii TaxID=1381693 RepID=A0ABP0LFA4_9DINO
MDAFSQVPLPSGPKPSYSRNSTRPTSAGTARSESPRSRNQRPLSARSAGSAWEARASASPSPDFTDSWSELPSRPGSRPGSRPTSATTGGISGAVTRRPSADGPGAVPNDASRAPEVHSLEQHIMASPDFGRRSLEEELREPILTPIPNSLGTPLEKQVATAIGLRGKGRNVLRLPRSVVSCKHGCDCCWRWLARAALEQIWGGSLASLSLADSVLKIKEEFAQMQDARRAFETEQFRAKAAEEEVATLQHELKKNKVDGREFRILEREHGRLQNEVADLRAARGKLEAELEVQKRRSVEQMEVARRKAEGEVEALQARAQKAEISTIRLEATEHELRERIADLQDQLREEKLQRQEDAKKLKVTQRGGKKTGGKARAKKAGRSRSKSRSKSKTRGPCAGGLKRNVHHKWAALPHPGVGQPWRCFPAEAPLKSYREGSMKKRRAGDM